MGKEVGGPLVVSPQHADLLIVSGRISIKMVSVLKDVSTKAS